MSDLTGAPLGALDASQSRPAPDARAQASRLAHARGTTEIRKVAEDFEGMVLTELLSPMFENLDTDGLGGGGAGERMFRPMLVEQYAQGMSRSGGVGLADAIVKELAQMQTNTDGTDGADR